MIICGTFEFMRDDSNLNPPTDCGIEKRLELTVHLNSIENMFLIFKNSSLSFLFQVWLKYGNKNKSLFKTPNAILKGLRDL